MSTFATPVICDPTPDWTISGTSVDLVRELSTVDHCFEFKGPGWYINPDGSCVLLIKADPSKMPWVGNGTPDTRYRAFVYNDSDVLDKFNAIANARVREDRRP